MTPKRIFRFFIRYASHPTYVVLFGVLYFLDSFRIKVRIYDESELTEQIRGGKSLIRIGDGEINLLLGIRNHYHSFSKELRHMLREIIRAYGTESPYILAVPRAITQRNDILKTQNRFHVWLPFKVFFCVGGFQRGLPYADAHSFYYDGFAERVLSSALSGKIAVLVTNENTIRKQRANPRLPWKNMVHVVTPESEALSSREQICCGIDTALGGHRKEEVVLLIAAGPLGKYIVKEYAEKGYQALDIGRGAEVMFTNESIQHLI